MLTETNTILVVDDDAVNRTLLAELLNSEARVLLAKDGPSALERCRERNDIDLVLLDISMPEMSGHQVLQILRKDPRTAGIPVIFITAMDKEEDEVHGLSLGAVDYIRKPIRPEIVRARVRNQLRLVRQRKTAAALANEPVVQLPVPRRPAQGLLPRKLKFVTEFIEENLGNELSLEIVSKAANISPSHFAALFKQSTGFSYHQFLMRRRVEKAKTLLYDEEIPISEVAKLAGFADQSHMTRLLRRFTGMTPKMIRGR